MTAHPEPARYERFDDQPAGARRELLDHAAACPDCRARLLRGDASRLFAFLALPPVPAGALERLGAGLARELDRGTPRRPSWRIPFAAAGLAASLILAGFFGLYALHATRVESPFAAIPAAPPATVASEREAPASGIQLISSPGEAQVLELTIGETQVTMIFDEALDI